MKRIYLFSCVLGASLLLAATTAFAAGFALQEQSGRGLGQAFAGVTTGLGDGSSIFYNPGAMTLIDDPTLSFTGNIITTATDFDDRGSTDGAGNPLAGGDGPDPGATSFVGNLYAVYPINQDIRAGFGINTPFGLATEYNDQWVGRYQAVKSELVTINLNPAVSYDLSDQISIGGGVTAMYADATLTNAVDFGTIGVSQLGVPTASTLGLLPQQADGFADVEGDDWGVGFNLGVLLRPFDGTRLGIGYRSKVDLNLTGDADFTVPANAQVLTSTGSFIDTTANARVSLPETLSFGFSQEITDDFILVGEAQWNRWSRVNEIRISFDSAQADSVETLNYEDNWRFALGGNYLMEEFVLRGGISYEQTPVSKGFRTARIPDADRWWFTAGVGWEVVEDIVLDVSYAWVHAINADVDRTGSTGDTLVGSYQGNVNIVAVEVTAAL